MTAAFRPLLCLLLLLCLGRPGRAREAPFEDYRWGGADFAFCLVTDDGTLCNLGWAEVALANGFRFTAAVNAGTTTYNRMSSADVTWLSDQGFEIANHGYSHASAGLPSWCSSPPRGSLLGYFQCTDYSEAVRMVFFAYEIDRGIVADYAGCDVREVRTFAYPRHLYSRAVVDSLMARGYLGARSGDAASYEIYGDGQYVRPPSNTWDGGISLYRVPVAHYSTVFFGDHSADPPVHYTHEEFLAAASPYVDQARRDGGIFVLYAHHYGDDNDEAGDANFGSGGMTPQDLAWMVELVRERGGKVLRFGDAVGYYRSRSRRVERDGDYVWVPKRLPDPAIEDPAAVSVWAGPNPFNPSTVVEYFTARDARVVVTVHDAAGRRIRELVDAPHTAGRHRVDWDGRDRTGAALPSGVYFLRIDAGGVVAVGRATLLK